MWCVEFRGGIVNGIELPLVIDAFESVIAAVLELEAPASDKVHHRPSGEDVAAVCEALHAGGDVNGDAGDVVTAPFDFRRHGERRPWPRRRISSVGGALRSEDYGHVGIDTHQWIIAPRCGDVVTIAAMPSL